LPSCEPSALRERVKMASVGMRTALRAPIVDDVLSGNSQGRHSMYKPSDTCVNGVILRGVLFWESCFFGTVLLCNSLKPSIF
jgi:hypothetical protein